MSVLNLRIHKGLLDCNYCRQPLLPDKWWRITYMVGEMRSAQSFCFFPSSTSLLLGLAVRWRPHLLSGVHQPTQEGMYLLLPFAGRDHGSDEVQMQLLRLWKYPLLRVCGTRVRPPPPSRGCGTAGRVRLCFGGVHPHRESPCLF